MAKAAYTIKNYIPTRAISIDDVEVDLTTSRVHAIRANAAGTLYYRLVGDAAGVYCYATLAAGEVLYGQFAQVRRGSFSAGQLIAFALPLE